MGREGLHSPISGIWGLLPAHALQLMNFSNCAANTKIATTTRLNDEVGDSGLSSAAPLHYIITAIINGLSFSLCCAAHV